PLRIVKCVECWAGGSGAGGAGEVGRRGGGDEQGRLRGAGAGVRGAGDAGPRAGLAARHLGLGAPDAAVLAAGAGGGVSRRIGNGRDGRPGSAGPRPVLFSAAGTPGRKALSL